VEKLPARDLKLTYILSAFYHLAYN
jgi:hypothetical protein